MVDGGNESLGVAVLNLTGTRSAARPGPPPKPPPALAPPLAYCVYARSEQSRQRSFCNEVSHDTLLQNDLFNTNW